MGKRPVVWITGALVLGEVIAYWSGKTAWLFVLMLCAAGAAAFFAAGGRFYLLLAAVCLAGVLRMGAELRESPLEKRIEAEGKIEDVTARGRIAKVSEKNGWYTITLSDAVLTDGTERWRQKRLLVSGECSAAGASDWLREGNLLLAQGSAEPLEEARNPGGFSYALYYRGKKIRCRLQADRLLPAAGPPAPPLVRQAAAFKDCAGQALETVCLPRDAGVFQAILLGDKAQLDGELKARFEDNGIAHILAVSGLHVSLIGLTFYGILRRLGLGYGTAGLAAALTLFFYGTVTGFGASVFRAVFMMLCILLASYLGRSYDRLSAMALSLFLLALDSPFLLFSAGLQLSYGAVTAICLEQERKQAIARARERREAAKPKETAQFLSGGPGQEDGSGRIREREEACLPIRWGKRAASYLGKALSVSAAIQFYTLPIQLWHFFYVPPWGILLNLVVIPLMSYAAASGLAVMAFYGAAQLFGSWALSAASFRALPAVSGVLPAVSGVLPAVSGVLSAVSGVLSAASGAFLEAARGAAGPGHYIFSLYDALCRTAGELPFARIVAGQPVGWQIAVFYVFLAGWYGGTILWEARKDAARRVLPCAAALVLMLVRPVHGLQVWFLDVGQGDGVFFRTRDLCVLSDCGSSQDRNVGRDRLLPFLESQGVTRLDCVLASHGDADHINGIEWLLEEGTEIDIGVLALPQAGQESPEYDRLRELAALRRIPVRYLKQRDQLSQNGVSLECLFPDGEADPLDTNAHSLVLAVSYGEFRMLLTGDIGSEQELRLLETGQLSGLRPVSVLKAAHHGSAGSSSEPFLSAVSPRLTVFSYGAGNRYGHPAPEAVRRVAGTGSEIRETARGGAICIRTDGKTMRAVSFTGE